MSNVQNITVSDDMSDQRLDRWFKRMFPQVTQGMIQKMCRTGQIRVDGKRVETSTRLESGNIVRVPPLPTAPAPAYEPKIRVDDHKHLHKDIYAAVLYKDADVIVLNKPYGMAVQGGKGVDESLDVLLAEMDFGGGDTPRLVHRLDRDTTGCLVLARNLKAASKLTEAFRERDARKYYLAITMRVPEINAGKIDLPLLKGGNPGQERVSVNHEEGKKAISLYRVLDSVSNKAALVALWPKTGRTHQLRAHMAAIDCPIIGDFKYGGGRAETDDPAKTPVSLTATGLSRQMHLHAWRIILPHPSGKGMLDVTAPIPPHLATSCRYFGFDPPKGYDPFEGIE